MQQMHVKLRIYRNLSNRLEGLPDDSPRAKALHDLRARALDEAFPVGDPALTVISWGETKSETPHEWVEIGIAIAPEVFRKLIAPAAKRLAQKIAEKFADEAAGRVAGAILARLWPEQEKDRIWDYTIELPDGTTLHVDRPVVDRPVPEAKVTIRFKDGKVEEIAYAAA